MGGIAAAPHPDAVINQVITLKAVTNAALQDVVDGGGDATIYGIEIDCTLNASEDVHLRLANALTATAGTTQPEMQLLGKKGVKTTYLFPRGVPFSTGVSGWCAQEAAYSSNTAPTGTVNATLLLKDSV